MKTILATLLAGGFTLAIAAAAHAQAVPQIPTPVNPYPINPVATDGTPLPSQSNAVRSGGYSGRSAAVAAPFAFIGDVANTGLGVVGGAVDTGVNGFAGNGYAR